MKKVLLAALLILALCLSLAACGGSKAAKTTPSTAAPTETEEPATESVPPETKSSSTPVATTTPTEATEAPVVDNGQTGAETVAQATPNVQSSSSFEDFVRSYYYTCQSLSDDGVVRDYFTKDPIEFSYNGEDVVWYAYKSGGEYRSVYISSYGGDPGSYQVTWG